MSFIWYQMVGGNDPWLVAPADHREKILRERKPAFVTVLDAHGSPDDTWGRDDYAALKYTGPFYADWDAESVEETIPQFQKFLTNLQDMGVNLASLRLYATGGRGFHIEIPAPVFMAKPLKTGVVGLPYLYREMAMKMVVDTLDLRVYTGRKGRMWRTCGVERSNGKFKVPITVDQAMGMTLELYNELCAAPIPEPTREDPELNSSLTAMFNTNQTKVNDALKRRSKGNVDQDLLLRHKGQFPPTVERIMRGEGLAPGVGFQKLAMQLAITANALGKTSDQLVEACEGLCKNHNGDSERYNSPRKRKEELRRMFEYTNENPCYSYSRGGIRSLVDVDSSTSDLDGLSGHAMIGSVPEGDADDEEEQLPDEVQAELTSAGASLLEQLMITKSGVHRRTADGAKTISNIGFRKPMLLLDADDKMVLGLEAEILCDGKSAGRHPVPGKSFVSRAALNGFCGQYGGIFSGTDTQASVVNLMLVRSAKKGNRIMYSLHKEGLVIIQNPLITDRVEKDVVWVHPDEVMAENTEAGYIYQPSVGSSPTFKADVHRAKPLEKSGEVQAWLHNLLDINSPLIVAQCLGWFVSCFHKPFYIEGYEQFPLLHPNGPAQSGKTMTCRLLGRMFYLASEPLLQSCASSTKEFALKSAMTASTSVPLLLDEYKPSEMGSIRTAYLTNSFRLAYNNGSGSSGGMTRGNIGGSFRDVTNYTYSTPLCYMGESQEMQSAVLQRSVPVSFSMSTSEAHREQYELARAGQHHMPALGSLILRHSLRETVQKRREALDPIIHKLREHFKANADERFVFNLAVLLAGLGYLEQVLATKFGDEFTAKFAQLKDSLVDAPEKMSGRSMSEADKMLNDLALISRTEEPESEFALREGYEYIVKEGTLELLMRETFVKYFAWCKRKGFSPYYINSESFVEAMRKHSSVTDSLCFGSLIKRTGQAKVFRFDTEKLSAAGVETFKSKVLDK